MQFALSARVECRGKAFQAIVCLFLLTEGVAPGYLHRKRYVQPSRLVVATISYEISIELNNYYKQRNKPTLSPATPIYKQPTNCIVCTNGVAVLHVAKGKPQKDNYVRFVSKTGHFIKYRNYF